MTIVTNAESFAKYIHGEVAHKGVTYIDAIIDFCAERDLEPEAIVPFIDDCIRLELQREGTALHLLPNNNALPLE